MKTRLPPLALAAAIALAGHAGAADAQSKRRGTTPFPALTPDGMPNVQAAAALVVDLDDGAVLYDKNADDVRAIASTGKIFVAMVVRRRGIDLDAVTEITEIDREHARGGARTRLHRGDRYRNRDLLKAMLIASDNRACTALGRAVGLEPEQLIAEMNALARSLGLRHTRFSDPSGLRGNESTPRELALAMGEAMKDPLIAELLATDTAVIESVGDRPRRVHYRNTNRSLHSQRWPVIGGKTGYTSAAGYCLIIAAEIAERRVGMVFLGTQGRLTRYGDFNRVAAWMAKHTERSKDETVRVD